jgi:hypothetical protein
VGPLIINCKSTNRLTLNLNRTDDETTGAQTLDTIIGGLKMEAGVKTGDIVNEVRHPLNDTFVDNPDLWNDCKLHPLGFMGFTAGSRNKPQVPVMVSNH